MLRNITPTDRRSLLTYKLRTKEFLINTLWLLAILCGVLSVPIVMVWAGRSEEYRTIMPGIVEFTIPEHKWHSMAGYDCVDPEHYAVCTLAE